MSGHNLETTIAMIRAHHRERIYAMEQRKRADLSLGWYLKTSLGWSKVLPADERDAIADHAAQLVAIGEETLKREASTKAWAAKAAKRKGKAKAAAEAKAKEYSAPAEGSADLDFVRLSNVIIASVMARTPFDGIEAANTAAMERLAEHLPVWAWAEPIRGFGPKSLAIVVGEVGDLSNYANPAKVWKRMGLAVMDGVRQGGLKKSASKDDWIAHGYNRNRRSRMWNIGQSLVKGNGEGEFRALYLERLAVEHAKALAEGLIPATTGKATVESWAKRGLPPLTIVKKIDPKLHRGAGHMDRRAQRYMEKRLLRELWRAWRDAIVLGEPRTGVHPADNSDDARQCG